MSGIVARNLHVGVETTPGTDPLKWRSDAERTFFARMAGYDESPVPVIGGKPLDEWEMWLACIEANDQYAIVVNTYLPEDHMYRIRINTRHWE